MWLYLAVAALAIIGIAGSVAGAGIFTIVLIPIAIIVLVAGLAYRSMGQAAGGGGASGGTQRLPTSSPSDPARVQASPEDLVDARRRQQ